MYNVCIQRHVDMKAQCN